jgi:hypothetical protein
MKAGPTQRWTLRNRKGAVAVLSVAAGVVLSTQPAHADIGLPMLAVVWPVSWALLVLIIPLEAWIAARLVGSDKALRMATAANLVSTLVGVPVTWVLLVILQCAGVGGGIHGLDTTAGKLISAVLQSPWLVPHEKDFYWMVPIAAATLCVPFFLMSVGCEYLVARRFFERTEHRRILRWAWLANAASYGMVEVVLAAMVAAALLGR